MIIAQISDFHITAGGRLAYRRVDTARALAAAVTHINELDPRPDLVMATGDLVDLGTAEEYARLRELLAPLLAPVFVIPGNHDERGALRGAFGRDGYLPRQDECLHYAIEKWPVRILALDTVVPSQGYGALSTAQIAWLDARLAEQPNRPTVVAMHHPPFVTGIAHMDEIRLLEGADALGAVIEKHPQVERVICGHVHRAVQVRWRGTIASIAPSTAHQVVLDLREDAPSTFVLEPPGLQLHLWRDGQGLISHTATIGQFEGPYPFFAESGELVV